MSESELSDISLPEGKSGENDIRLNDLSPGVLPTETGAADNASGEPSGTSVQDDVSGVVSK